MEAQYNEEKLKCIMLQRQLDAIKVQHQKHCTKHDELSKRNKALLQK
jgi:hypothetical protein